MTEEALERTKLTAAPPIVVPLNNPRAPPLFDPEGVPSLNFTNYDEAAGSCGISRLWAGVHLRPAISAGKELSKGIGRIAYEHVRELANGRVPSVCTRCTQK